MLPSFPGWVADPMVGPELKVQIRQDLLLTGITMHPLGALMIDSGADCACGLGAEPSDQSASDLSSLAVVVYGDVCCFAQDAMCGAGVLCAEMASPFSRQYEFSQRSACLCFCANFRRTGFSSQQRGVNLVSCFVILAAGSRRLNGCLAALDLPIGLTGWQLCGGV